MEKHKINYSKIFDELFPINRSILGDGYKKSLKIIKNLFLLKKKDTKVVKKFLIGLSQKNG